MLGSEGNRNDCKLGSLALMMLGPPIPTSFSARGKLLLERMDARLSCKRLSPNGPDPVLLCSSDWANRKDIFFTLPFA